MGHLENRAITVIGAGIAGLTVAVALARHGARVHVLERSTSFGQVGSGIQISPNAGRVLDRLGLGGAADAASLRSEGVVLRNRSGSEIARMALGARRPDQPFRLFHRADLIDMLASAARDAGVTVSLGHDAQADLSDPAGDLLVGADGLHSRVRASLNGDQTPFFTGQIAWRALIDEPADPATHVFAEVFTGPGRHLVSYPLAGGRRNIVAVMETPQWSAEGWSHADDPANLRDAFAGFGGPVQGWLSRVQRVGKWGLFRHLVAPVWHDTDRVILGDAAHPTLPFMAQGAVMAIEDAWVLAACLDAGADQLSALRRYQSIRAARARRIVEMANRNARAYHLEGPARMVGHAGLRTLSRLMPSALLGRFDWIYDHDPTELI